MGMFKTSKKFIGVVYKELVNGDRSYYVTYKIANKFKRVHIGKKSEGVNEIFCHQKRNEAINAAKFGEDTPLIKYKHKTIIILNDLAEVYFRDKEYVNSSNKRQLGKYNLHIKPVFGSMDIQSISRADVVKFRNNLLEKSKATKSINVILQLLTSIINYSIKEKDLKYINPCTGIKRLKVNNQRERFLTLLEVTELKHKVKDNDAFYIFVLIALNTGNRVNDILKLQKKHIDLQSGIITLFDSKNKSIYKGFFDLETKTYLKKVWPYLKINDYIVGGSSKPYASRTFSRLLLKIIDHLFNDGLDRKDTKNRAVIHTLRHTFASQLAIAGTPIVIIQKLMNHADIQMTMRYAKLAPDSGKDAVQNLYLT